MNKRLLTLLIGLICISLSGIIAVQFLWIRNAIAVREAQFDRSVNDALGVAINDIETRDNVCFIGKSCVRDSIRNVFKVMANDSLLMVDRQLDSLIRQAEMPEPDLTTQQQFFSYNLSLRNNHHPSQRHKRARRMMQFPDSLLLAVNDQLAGGDEFGTEMLLNWNVDDLNRLDSLFKQQEITVTADPFVKTFHGNAAAGSRIVVQYSVNPIAAMPPPVPHRAFRPPKTRYEQIRMLNNKAIKMQDVLKKMTIEMESRPRPIEERINKNEIASSLRQAFADKDIQQPFEFAVSTMKEGKPVIPIHSDGFRPEFVSTKYKVSLFPNDLFEKQNLLMIHFPGQSNNLLRSLSWLMIASILFTLIIILTSGMSIFVMIRQKKTSDIKTDFINNMTHEFKTPIATISIAVDSINNPKVIDQPEIIRNYTRVIKEENNRMNTRVEQVLQMALLDSSEFRLAPREIDINKLVYKITESFRLQTENRNGELGVQLSAERSRVSGDEAHLTNVILSLLDNAIKYSPDRPEIRVDTETIGNSVLISVEDHGIGMNADTQKKIFDKFFRVTSGNIHNIKGFGLGLSYAKAIVLAHKGEIRVESEPGKGSRFEVLLPLMAE